MNSAARIVSSALGVVAGETLVVVTDRSRLPLAESLTATAEGLGAKSRAIVLESLDLGEQADLAKTAREILDGVQASVMLVGAEHSPPFRRAFVEAVETLGVRHAHIIGISRKAFATAFAAEASRVSDLTRNVYLKITGRSSFKYQTPVGTKLEVRFPDGARFVERGELIRPGKWVNLPGGQLNGLAEEVDGVFVADSSSNLAVAGSADLRGRPLTFTLARGVVQSVTCPDPAAEAAARAILASEEKLDRIGHLVIGTNPGLSSPMGESMIDSCIPGLQLVFGWTNQRATGASWTTAASFCANGSSGDLDVDGAPILRSGRYIL